MSAQRGRASAWRRIHGIVLLDKPLGLSSNDALQRVRRLFRAEKAGHTGSLDPLATGLLPICFGEATKLCGLLLDGDKHYRATICLGSSTTTGDLEGEFKASSDASGVNAEQVRAALIGFLGLIRQVPPMHSALKHQGRALYELAREGIEVERAPREVYIRRLELVGFRPGWMELDVVCSKGTYIRTLAEDIAAGLGQQAHLLALRRLGAEPFTAAQRLWTLDQLSDAAESGAEALDATLAPPLTGVSHWPQWQAGDAELAQLKQGGSVPAMGVATGKLAVVDLQGRLRGLARFQDGRVFPERWMLVD